MKMHTYTENINIESTEVLLTPSQVKTQLPLSEGLQKSIIEHRKTLQKILDGEDKRLFVVVGPCSIHDPVAAIDYAKKLKRLASEVADTIVLVMRVYFEKPRTTTGWKGLINDPHLNGSFDIKTGLLMARKLMIELAELAYPWLRSPGSD